VQSLFLSGECSRITYGVKEPRDLGMHELAVYTSQVQPCKLCRPIRRLIQRVLADDLATAEVAR
jgi:hypothetical protein